jgi:hypothetical protein
MAEEKNVRILEWPKQKALLEHYFKLDEPCPVSIIFEDKPAHVKVSNEREDPFNVAMNMNLKVTDEIPVCIRICEPICAVSDYSIGIELLGQPLASIRVKGQTKLANCKEDPVVTSQCVDFIGLDPKKNKSPLTRKGVQFTPLNEAASVNLTTMGLPTNQLKLSIPDAGMRIDFPKAVRKVSMTIVNFGNPVIEVNSFFNANLIANQSEMIQNTTATFQVNGATITALEIKGGSNEAAIVEVCFEETSSSPNDPVVIF